MRTELESLLLDKAGLEEKLKLVRQRIRRLSLATHHHEDTTPLAAALSRTGIRITQHTVCQSHGGCDQGHGEFQAIPIRYKINSATSPHQNPG